MVYTYTYEKFTAKLKWMSNNILALKLYYVYKGLQSGVFSSVSTQIEHRVKIGHKCTATNPKTITTKTENAPHTYCK